ncbi:MAG: hypothetical protein AOA66_0537 [Candidatus Bathyarchaeota archaeon BA2]|nr:MAG: hypothetical protein AOA66_0537 [Candidatus Bathyarchaeota archaeon BA2]
MFMSGKWTQDCERILNEIKKSTKVKGKDCLDIVRMIRFTLFAPQRSVTGWIQWADNPDVMAQFSLEELKEINKNLAELVSAFVEYDAKMTGRTEMELIKKEDKTQRELRKKAQGKKDIFYVK